MTRPPATPIVLGALAFLQLACGDEISGPSQSNGIRIEAAVSSQLIEPGETGAITLRLRNLQPYAVTITFSSTCQLLVHVEGISNGFEYPAPPNGHACGDMITSITMEPFAEHSMPFEIHGQTNARYEAQDDIPRILLPGLGLPAGRYRARALLGHNYGGLQLQSRVVEFEVRSN